jgi:hypothetical protein
VSRLASRQTECLKMHPAGRRTRQPGRSRSPKTETPLPQYVKEQARVPYTRVLRACALVASGLWPEVGRESSRAVIVSLAPIGGLTSGASAGSYVVLTLTSTASAVACVVLERVRVRGQSPHWMNSKFKTHLSPFHFPMNMGKSLVRHYPCFWRRKMVSREGRKKGTKYVL